MSTEYTFDGLDEWEKNLARYRSAYRKNLSKWSLTLRSGHLEEQKN